MPVMQLNSVQISYQDSGPRDAPAILLAHSLFFDHRMFEHQIAHFSDRYRVVVYDQRGHGDSPHPADGRYDMDTLTDDAAALIESLRLGAVHVVGNSMGGFIALRLGARRPELVRSVTAVGSSADKEHKVEQYRPLVEALKQHGAAPVVEPLMYTMFGDTTLSDASRAGLRETWRSRMAALPSTIGEAAEAVVERRGVTDELSRIKAPVLAIAGAEDHAYTVELSEQIARLSIRGDCVVVGAAGHSTCLEAPEPVNRALAAHFGRAEADHARGATA